MTANGWIQILLYMAIIFAVTKPMGNYMYRVFEGDRQPLPRLFGAIERLLYKLCGVDPRQQQDWKQYTVALLVFSALTLLVTYCIARLQHVLPLNPQNFGPVPGDLAFNTAASFTTNTNWQAYSGESTMSYLTQMAGLAYHNFVSAATGIALAIAFIRGIAQKEKDTIGNFWVDLVRCSLWVLLPFCLIGALVLVSQGVVQNLRPYDTVAVIDPQTVTAPDANGKPQSKIVTEQVIAQGPVAPQ